MRLVAIRAVQLRQEATAIATLSWRVFPVRSVFVPAQAHCRMKDQLCKFLHFSIIFVYVVKQAGAASKFQYHYLCRRETKKSRATTMLWTCTFQGNV